MSKPVDKIKIFYNVTTSLYAVRGGQLQGAVERCVANTQFKWVDKGSVSWETNVLKSGEYEIALCYSSFTAGTKVKIICGDNVISEKLRATKGYFTLEQTSNNYVNYERVTLGSKFYLAEGENSITIEVIELADNAMLQICSLELTPVDAKEANAVEDKKAIAMRSSTDWMVDAGYGLMFHWTSQSKPRHGTAKKYSDAVDDFDVEAFAEMVHSTGAGYIFFTTNHGEPACPAPIKSWEDIHPGWTTKRDLIREVADALKKYNIKLILYIHLLGLGKMNMREGNLSGYSEYTEEGLKKYISNICRVLTEIGERYGEDVAGYWFDCCYQHYERYGYVSFEEVFKATKAGNKDRVSTLNFYTFPISTPHQDYWAGEMCAIGNVPEQRYMDSTTFKSLQFQTLLIMDDMWVHDKLEAEVDAPHYTAEELGGYINECMKNKGVVTVNLGIYQDGTIGEKTWKVMKRVKEIVRG